MSFFTEAREEARKEARASKTLERGRASMRLGRLVGAAEAAITESPKSRALRLFAGTPPGLERKKRSFRRRVKGASQAVGAAFARAGTRMEAAGKRTRKAGGGESIPAFLKEENKPSLLFGK